MTELDGRSEAPLNAFPAALREVRRWLSFDNDTKRRARFLTAHLLLESLIIVVGFQLYSVVADRAPRRSSEAFGRTAEILRGENVLGLAAERRVNTWWAQSHLREVVGNYYYDGAHFIVTVGVLWGLLILRPSRYRMHRDVLVVTSLLALVMFWLWPVAPPRLLPSGGFVDTVAQVRTMGSGGEHGITSAENPFAAMPSLHVGWALWVATATRTLTERRWLRALGWSYPALTVFVVVATGNHLLADAGAAVLLVAIATLLVRTGFGFRRRRFGAGRSPGLA
jgi:PAP2 superfamily